MPKLWDMNVLTKKGMPRPLGDNDGVPRPIPWTNGENWGVQGDSRQAECAAFSWCLVCGKKVYTGIVFAIAKDEDGGEYDSQGQKIKIKKIYHQKDLGWEKVLDEGPMHNKCAKLTRAHCKHVRKLLHSGVLAERRYTNS